jgi:hypothetical protein
MTTIEQLEQRALDVMNAEAAAVGRLVDHVRDIAVELPDGSRLAIDLAKIARRLEEHTSPPRARYAATPLSDLEREMRDDRKRNEAD